jgi:hypothetical protein
MKHLLISVQKPDGFFTTGFVEEEAVGFVTGGVTSDGVVEIGGVAVSIFFVSSSSGSLKRVSFNYYLGVYK